MPSDAPKPTYRKPLPQINVWNRPFWDACKEHKFMAQQDKKSGEYWFPPGPICPTNRSTDWEWKQLAGTGTIRSWVVFHQRYYSGFADDIPYNVAIVGLDEGPEIMTNIVNTTNDKLHIGMRVKVVFRDTDADVTIPVFEPSGEAAR